MLCRYTEFHAFAIFRQLTDQVLLFIILHWLRHYYYLSWCLVTCRHFENNSDRLFKKFFFFAFINKSFSSRHKLHRFDPALYAATCFIMDHLMWWSRFPIFNFQICFDNSVSLAYFTYRKDLVWLRYLSLKSLAVIPIQFLVSPLSVVVTLAWQTKLLAKQFSAIGHSSGRWQLHLRGSLFVVWFCVVFFV